MSKPRPIFIVDFDGTAFDTIDEPKNGLNIGWATYLSLLEHTDKTDYARYREVEQIYLSVTGKKPFIKFNKETTELMASLHEKFLESSLSFDEVFDASREELMPRFVHSRKKILLEHITREWPKPYPGFPEFHAKVLNGEIAGHIVIATSNHHEIIQKAFFMQGLLVPKDNDIISSDTIIEHGHSGESLSKPNPFSVHLAVARLHPTGITLLGNDLKQLVRKDWYRDKDIIVVGNDRVKDGDMAWQAGTAYWQVPHTDATFQPNQAMGQATGDFYQLAAATELANARNISITKQLTGRERYEIAPWLYEQEAISIRRDSTGQHFWPSPERW